MSVCTATIGAAQSLWLTFSITPAASNQSSSLSNGSHRANGTERGWTKMGWGVTEPLWLGLWFFYTDPFGSSITSPSPLITGLSGGYVCWLRQTLAKCPFPTIVAYGVFVGTLLPKMTFFATLVAGLLATAAWLCYLCHLSCCSQLSSLELLGIPGCCLHRLSNFNCLIEIEVRLT